MSNPVGRVVIGVDPHKLSATIAVLDQQEKKLGSGRFTTDHAGYTAMRTYASEANFQRLDRASLLADEKGLTAAQVALAYVMNQPMNLFAVVGPHSGEKFKTNIEASEMQLTPQEMDWLDLKAEGR